MTQFALNHMAAPRLTHVGLFDLAVSLGVRDVEIRNDLAGVAILDGTSAATIRADAAARGLNVITINALQRFNQWTPARAEEARRLAAYAHECGAVALVLCPVNDAGWRPSEADRLAYLREALAGLLPIFRDAGVTGLVEPLGFEECSLRLKSEAVAAIDAVGGGEVFALVQDTFHHAVAGEAAMFPTRTGLVHISGVEDASVPLAAIRDPHRVLVGPADRVHNAAQIRTLAAGGYSGLFSFEPFSAEVHGLADIGAALKASMAFVADELRAAA